MVDPRECRFREISLLVSPNDIFSPFSCSTNGLDKLRPVVFIRMCIEKSIYTDKRETERARRDKPCIRISPSPYASFAGSLSPKGLGRRQLSIYSDSGVCCRQKSCSASHSQYFTLFWWGSRCCGPQKLDTGPKDKLR